MDTIRGERQLFEVVIFCESEVAGLRKEEVQLPWTNRYFPVIDILFLPVSCITFSLFLYFKKSLIFQKVSYIYYSLSYFRKDANSDRTAEYFKPLGKERVERLFRIYQIDFEMFDYRHEIYSFS